jgi:hypothetical protein
MKALREYAGVITAMVSVLAAMGALGLWAINLQVKPEVNRLEGRIDSVVQVMNARFDLMDEKFRRVDDRFEQIDGRFKQVDERFGRVEGDIKTIRQDVKTILLRLPAPPEAG